MRQIRQVTSTQPSTSAHPENLLDNLSNGFAKGFSSSCRALYAAPQIVIEYTEVLQYEAVEAKSQIAT